MTTLSSINPQVPADVVNLFPEATHEKLNQLWRERDGEKVAEAISMNQCLHCRTEFHENVHRSKAQNSVGGYYSSKGPLGFKHLGVCEFCLDEMLAN